MPLRILSYNAILSHLTPPNASLAYALSASLLLVAFTLASIAEAHSADEVAARTTDEATATGDKNLFRERVAPILSARCQACHGAKEEGGYSVSTPAKFLTAGDSESTPVVPNKLDESELWRRLNAKDESERMPPDSEPLSDAQLAAVKKWIEAGAPIDAADLSRPMAELTMTARTVAPEHYPRPLAVHSLSITGTGDEVFVGGYAEVTRWKVATGELVARIPTAGPHVASIAVSDNNELLVVSSGSPAQGGVIEAIAINHAGFPRAALPTTADVAPNLAFSPKGLRVAIGGHDGSLRMTEVQSDHRFGDVQVLTPHADAVLAVAWSEDGERLMTASRDRTAKLFDAKSLELMASYDRHERAVGGVGFFGKRTLSFDETGRLRMMPGDDSDGVIAEQAGLPRLLQQFSTAKDLIFVPDRHRLRRFLIEKKTVDNGTTEDGKPKTKDVTRFHEQPSLDVTVGEWITSVAVNESAIAVGTQQGTVTVWARANEEQRTALKVTP